MKRLVFCCFLFLCFQQAKALYFPSDSLKLKPKKYSHFVGVGNKTGGAFKNIKNDGGPESWSSVYHLNNILTLNYLLKFNNQSLIYFALENTFDIKKASRVSYYNHLSNGIKDSITGKGDRLYSSFSLNPSINCALIKKNKLKYTLSFGLTYQLLYYILNETNPNKIPPPNFGLTNPFINFKLSNGLNVKIRNKSLEFLIFISLSKRPSQQLLFIDPYTTKDFVSDFDYEIDGNIQRVLYKTLGFNLYYQL